jgi:hypothetical protein
LGEIEEQAWMATPSSSEARLFYRCAILRYEDAQLLLREEHTTGAVYLAGYGIECILKALILSVVSPGQLTSVLSTFRGQRAHSYEWLREEYYNNKGARFPQEVNQHFTFATRYWSPVLRYQPGSLKLGDAEDFIAAVAAIIEWAKGRF